MNIHEHLEALRKSREDAKARMNVVAQKSMDEGRSMNDAEQQEFDAIETELKAFDADIARFVKLAEIDKASAKPVVENKDISAAVGGTKPFATVKNTQKLDKGIAFARIARVRALAEVGLKGIKDPGRIAHALYPDDEDLHNFVTGKAAVSAANTGTDTWAGNLINEGGAAFADFVEYLRPTTLLGQIGGRLRNLPFDTPVLVQSSGGTGKWVKEGAAKPLTKWGYTRAKLAPLKVAAIAAATKESLQRASIAADQLLRDELARAVGATIDGTFIDPSVEAVADTSPSSVLNGITALTMSDGTTIANIRKDIVKFLTAFTGANLSLTGAFWVMPEAIAVNLSLIANEVGAPAFPGITPTGGTLAGLPVFTTNYAPVVTGTDPDPSGSVVALILGNEIFVGDEGGVQVSMSDQASLVMDDAPSSDSTTPTAASVVSLWQTNSVAFLVERFINWQRRRDASVAFGYVNWAA